MLRVLTSYCQSFQRIALRLKSLSSNKRSSLSLSSHLSKRHKVGEASVCSLPGKEKNAHMVSMANRLTSILYTEYKCDYPFESFMCTNRVAIAF